MEFARVYRPAQERKSAFYPALNGRAPKPITNDLSLGGSSGFPPTGAQSSIQRAELLGFPRRVP